MTHTIICGTSKSRSEDGYYIKEKDKFWGLIHAAGVTSRQLMPGEYREFQQYGFCIFELVSTIIPQDKLIPLNDKQKNEILNTPKEIASRNPNRVFFNGKKAAEWYLQALVRGNIRKKGYPLTKNLNYGKQTDLNQKFNLDLKYDIFILPNTSGSASRYWNREKWLEAWKECLEDIS